MWILCGSCENFEIWEIYTYPKLWAGVGCGRGISHRIEFEKAKNILSRANNGCADDVLIVICQPRSAQLSAPRSLPDQDSTAETGFQLKYQLEMDLWERSVQCLARYYHMTRSLGPSGPRLLVRGPSGLLNSSFAPFGRSGRVTHAALIGEDGEDL